MSRKPALGETGVDPAANPDTELLTELSRHYRAALTGYFAKRVRDGGEVDDLVQEVFLRLATRSNLGDIEQIRGYLFATAASVFRDWLRRRATRRSDEHVQLHEGDNSTDGLSPERVLLGKEELQALVEALKELPARTRHIFVLRRYEGLRVGAIAERLGITEGGVRFHMVKAKTHLAERLGRKS